MIQNINPPRFGDPFEFIDEDAAVGVSAFAACARCDGSSRCGASGKSSSSARCILM